MKLCIETASEGFAVYDEANPDMPEMAASVDEALEIARSMLGGDAEMEEPKMDGEEAFTQGFKQARGGMEV